MRKKFLKSITEERENRKENKKKNNHKLLKFWNNFVNIKNNKKSLNLKIAFEMAKNFKYSHGNSSDNDYFFHPLRIANMSLFFFKKRK